MDDIDIYIVQMPYTTGSKADWHSLDARYFVIKSNNMDNVEISMEKVSPLFSRIIIMSDAHSYIEDFQPSDMSHIHLNQLWQFHVSNGIAHL